jgi:lipopolysaccharide export system permease protein
LGLALAAFNVVILAVALASVNPRGGRSSNLIFVLLTFVVYNNLVNVGQSWIFSGVISFGALLLSLHGGVLLLGLGWLAKRHFNWALRPIARMRRPLPAVRMDEGSKA